MESLQGRFVIAAPSMQDPNFSQSVVYMVQHDDEGALGLIVNRPSDIAVREAWKEISEKPCSSEGVLFQGGPCPGVLMALHSVEMVSQIEVGGGVHFSTETEHIEWLAEHNHEARFFVGYAGWAPGQIESELNVGAWLLCPATNDDVFSPPETLWGYLLKRIDPALGELALNPRIVPEDPSMN